MAIRALRKVGYFEELRSAFRTDRPVSHAQFFVDGSGEQLTVDVLHDEGTEAVQSGGVHLLSLPPDLSRVRGSQAA